MVKIFIIMNFSIKNKPEEKVVVAIVFLFNYVILINQFKLLIYYKKSVEHIPT